MVKISPYNFLATKCTKITIKSLRFSRDCARKKWPQRGSKSAGYVVTQSLGFRIWHLWAWHPTPETSEISKHAVTSTINCRYDVAKRLIHGPPLRLSVAHSASGLNRTWPIHALTSYSCAVILQTGLAPVSQTFLRLKGVFPAGATSFGWLPIYQ